MEAMMEGPRLPAHRTLRTGANEGDLLLEEGAEARAAPECTAATAAAPPKARHSRSLLELRQACSKMRWVSSTIFVALLGTAVFFHLTHGDTTASRPTDLVTYALANPLLGSCSQLGCRGFDLSYACQCNPGCRKRGNCCPDYEAACPVPLENTTIPGLCSLLGCSTLHTGDESCQCHPHCKKEGNCCSDYRAVCTIEENIARALPDGAAVQACPHVGGRYTEGRSRETVTVRQTECDLVVQVGASRRVGSIRGRSISVEGFKSEGSLLDSADVKFGDGGYWTRDAKDVQGVVDAPLRTLEDVEDGTATGGPEAEEHERLKHMVVQGARTPLAQLVHNVLKAPIWHEMGV